MKRRIMCYLLSITMIISFIPCIAVQAATENELIQKLKNSISDNIVQTYYDDFDGDGENELFAFVGKSFYDNEFEMNLLGGRSLVCFKSCN